MNRSLQWLSQIFMIVYKCLDFCLFVLFWDCLNKWLVHSFIGAFASACCWKWPCQYTIGKMLKAHQQAQVDNIDRLPTPFGLVHSGVAPDHSKTKKECFYTRQAR
ncbi:uncharacterized protein LOC131606595 isoform X2 [Vicia villosa]|uniref:uncharacterized protein LOC131606595 isoform X2 n=1 Tax=Vicia villosa TaxID=3911 RepID=UPI00273C7D22|nr:uncharacterized protein LOC131606595 isoform X2 [Vicia villosa]